MSGAVKNSEGYVMDTVSLRMKSITLYNEYANEGWILGG